MWRFRILIFLLPLTMLSAEPLNRPAGFSTFDDQAKAGKPFSVVFLGGSLTWGAQATDPMETSYRALIGLLGSPCPWVRRCVLPSIPRRQKNCCRQHPDSSHDEWSRSFEQAGAMVQGRSRSPVANAAFLDGHVEFVRVFPYDQEYPGVSTSPDQRHPYF
jgi:prepilin-type processing-associated H-X9-DG protein